MAELLNCPFCGERSNLSVSTDVVMPDNYHNGRVSCGNCDMLGPDGIVLDGWLSSAEEADHAAREAWNRRSSSDEAEICGDERNGGLIRDMAYTVWHNCHHPTNEDGNSDWGNDNLPLVNVAVERVRAALYASPSGVKAGVTEAIEACAKIADEMRLKHSSPTGDAYTCGVWDQSVRIASKIRALGVGDEGMGEAT